MAYSISEITSMTRGELEALASRSDDLYHRTAHPKSSGGVRWISAPREPLKTTQRAILDSLLYQRAAHESAHGFVPKRSVITHARRHTYQRWLVGLDLYRFFDETPRSAVRSVFERFSGLQEWEVEVLTELCCLEDRLPQGAPTSPYITNLYFSEVDEALTRWAESQQLTYSRYADDLAFSGPAVPPDLFRVVKESCGEFGYRVNHKKTRVLGSGARQSVTGLVVNRGISVPRRLRRTIRAVLHDASKRGLESAMRDSDMGIDSLIGRIRWISVTHPELASEMTEALGILSRSADLLGGDLKERADRGASR